MADVSDETVVKIIDTINIFDKLGDGKLPVDSIMDCLRALGLNPGLREYKTVVKDLKDEGWERLDIEDFLPIYEHCLHMRKPSLQELCDGLKAISPDSERTGFISSTDLTDSLTTLGDRMTRDQVRKILDPLTEASGDVSVDLLVKTVTQGALIRKN